MGMDLVACSEIESFFYNWDCWYELWECIVRFATPEQLEVLNRETEGVYLFSNDGSKLSAEACSVIADVIEAHGIFRDHVSEQVAFWRESNGIYII